MHHKKETEKHFCNDCESEFKLIFEVDSTSGFPKFCPFCAGELNDREDEDEEEDDGFST